MVAPTLVTPVSMVAPTVAPTLTTSLLISATFSYCLLVIDSCKGTITIVYSLKVKL